MHASYYIVIQLIHVFFIIASYRVRGKVYNGKRLNCTEIMDILV